MDVMVIVAIVAGISIVLALILWPRIISMKRPIRD